MRSETAVVGPASSNDAAHIAVATISNVDLVVSWNLHGYRSPRIYSPREVVTP
jgi:hypothetical protein